eukprot:7148647-Ditylum_brightwellii.AAC.1
MGNNLHQNGHNSGSKGEVCPAMEHRRCKVGPVPNEPNKPRNRITELQNEPNKLRIRITDQQNEPGKKDNPKDRSHLNTRGEKIEPKVKPNMISLEKETIKAHATDYNLEIDYAKGEKFELTEKNQSIIQRVKDLNQKQKTASNTIKDMIGFIEIKESQIKSL